MDLTVKDIRKAIENLDDSAPVALLRPSAIAECDDATLDADAAYYLPTRVFADDLYLIGESEVASVKGLTILFEPTMLDDQDDIDSSLLAAINDNQAVAGVLMLAEGNQEGHAVKLSSHNLSTESLIELLRDFANKIEAESQPEKAPTDE